MTTQMDPTHKAEGCSAYLDTFSGLIPCIVLSYATDARFLVCRITRNKGPYKAGEVIENRTHWTPPKDTIRRRKYGTYIRPFRYHPVGS